jgi:hypothetical protein
MPAPVVTVEIGANLGNNDPTGFRLNDPIRGRLNNLVYTLGGSKFYDITSRLVSASTSRGRSQALDRIDAGQLSVVVDNFDRLFDPLYEEGFYYSQLIPGRELRMSCNGYPVIYTYIDDLDIGYEPGNRSVVSFQASDGLSTLTINNLPEVTPPIELSGARVTRILDLQEVNWPLDKRTIDAGDSQLSDIDVAAQTQAISYLQLIATSEGGEVFVSKDNKFVFKERNASPGIIDLIFTDEGSIPGFTAIPFSDLSVIYGSEQLYNRVVITNNQLFPDEAIAEDADSQAIYGPHSYSQDGLLNESIIELQYLADFLLARFKQPQYRFDSLTVVLDVLSESQQNEVLDLEIGDVVQVRFTPSGIPPAIEQSVKIIGISHDWQNNEKRITLSLEKIDFTLLTLDNPLLGILDEDFLTY